MGNVLLDHRYLIRDNLFPWCYLGSLVFFHVDLDSTQGFITIQRFLGYQQRALDGVSIDNLTQTLVKGTNANLLNWNCIFSLGQHTNIKLFQYLEIIQSIMMNNNTKEILKIASVIQSKACVIGYYCAITDRNFIQSSLLVTQKSRRLQ